MTEQSAHRDVALWSYERPSRGYFGYHLRAATADARLRLRQRLAALGPGETHRLRFGGRIENPLPWPQILHTDVVVTSGGHPAAVPNVLSLAIAPSDLRDLVGLLDGIPTDQEASVTVETAEGARPLWIWWDP